MSKHTPGPWMAQWKTKQYFSSDTGAPTFQLTSADVVCDDHSICHSVVTDLHTQDVARANAALIAAAPELLQALQHAVALFVEFQVKSESASEIAHSLCEEWERLINKATGESA